MHGLSNKDGDRRIDWGKTSKDYALSRPGPPSSFYRRLADLGVGLPGQHILDLGTGTGVLARQFGRQGARVAGVDIAQNQIRTARRLAEEDGLAIDFRATPAEQLPVAGTDVRLRHGQPVFPVLRQAGPRRRTSSRPTARRRPRHLPLLVDASQERDRAPIRSAGPRAQPRLVGQRLGRRDSRRPRLVEALVRGGAFVCVRRADSLHEAVLGRPHPRLPRRGRDDDSGGGCTL